MFFRNKNIVPSIMFHSVGLENYPWVWSYISESVDVFERKLKLLKLKQFTSIDWYQLYDHMSGVDQLPDDSILLTFDDGYLDNWVYIYPLLKKYGFKGTIYVNPDFVDSRDIVRPNLEDVWRGHIQIVDLKVAGFLSWSEMKLMQDSGVIDIQSHSLTHTWYFCGPNIVDYYHPDSAQKYPWMAWNEKPQRKPFYLNEDQSTFVSLGTPIFQHEKSLVVSRFFPDVAAVERIKSFINEHDVDNFRTTSNWRTLLHQQILSWYNGNVPGSYESIDQRIGRVKFELSQSKEIIENNLLKSVDFICWPGGGKDDYVLAVADDVGYKSWTLGSQDQSSYKNRFNSNPQFIKRIGSSNTVSILSTVCGQGGALYMWLRIGAHQESIIYKILLRSYQLFKWVVK